MSTSNSFTNQIINPFLYSLLHFRERNAFCINEIFYEYGKFGDCINRILTSVKLVDAERVYFGLVVNDDLETYASIFALWLEGKAYVPLHPHQPIDRSTEILSQMAINTVLDSSIASDFSAYTLIETSKLPDNGTQIEGFSETSDSGIAYILFTSGSTGKPKGVEISRGNLGAFTDSFWTTGINLTENDRCLQCFDLTFDVSIQSFLTPLLRGACVYTIPHNQIKYSYVYGLLTDHNLTFGAMAPSMLRFLRPYFDEIEAPDMKACILTAEASPADLAMEWYQCIPNADIYDLYGPTEATIYCTCYKVEKSGVNKTLNGMLSIGNPLKNVTAIIVDEDEKLLPRGEKGELCVSGGHISPGYWNDPEKTQRAFFVKEIEGVLHRFYRTGDVCYYDADGLLMLYGRIDSQVKIQGYRVELGEIEFHARYFLNGNNVVVLPFINDSGNTELALFIEMVSADTAALMDYLKQKLPFYMIPTKIIFEPQFLLNSNSKVDKLKLKEKLSSLCQNT